MMSDDDGTLVARAMGRDATRIEATRDANEMFFVRVVAFASRRRRRRVVVVAGRSSRSFLDTIRPA